MKHFLRPYHGVGIVLVLSAGMVVAPKSAAAQALQIVELLQGSSPLLLQHGSSQGYLGVLVGDVDADSAQKLRLKEVRGAVITLIDHDAPAGQKGLHVNDVVLKVNGQAVEGAEQFGRMMREIPAGHIATLVISRDGAEQTLAIQLVNHRAMEHDVWNRLGTESDAAPESPGMGVFAGGGDNALPGMFHMPIFGSTLNVGAMVEPLTEQMAEYLGVPNGLMVKQVAHKSEAATAGLKAFDVILKVGSEPVTTLSDWDRALRSNQGKQVQVTILRDKKQQTLNLQVDSKRKTGALEMEELFPDSSCALTAEVKPEELQLFAQDTADAAMAMKDKIQGIVKGEISAQQADELRRQAEALGDQLKLDNFKLDQKQMDELKRQMDEFRKSFKPEDFKIDPKRMDELKRQMDEFRKSFKPEDFKIDPKRMDELKRQMDEFRKSFKPEDFKIDPKQMDELKRQMEQFRMDFKPQDFEFAPN